MKDVVKVMIRVFILVAIVSFVDIEVLADDDNVGFNIQMVPSTKQINKDVSYFDLRLLPNEKETIKIRVNNTSDEESTYIVNINQAYTNDQGFIDYTDVSGSKKNDIPYRIEDIVSYEKKITLKAHSSQDVPIDIIMPNAIFDGQISAGIQVLKDQKKVEGQINVDYGYVLGLKITETDTPVQREMRLLEVKPNVYYGYPAVIARLQNPTADAYGHLRYRGSIRDIKTKNEIYKINLDKNMEMAPNSTFGLPIAEEGKRLVPGNYILNLVVSDAKGNEWSFEQDFTITKKQAKEINKVTIDKAQEKKHSYIWISIIVLLVLLLILLFYIYRKNKKG